MKRYIQNYNALNIDVFGNMQPVWIEDFADDEYLGKAVDRECERVDRVMTESLEQVSAELGFAIMGFVDGMGYTKNYIPNRYLQELAGYHTLLGPGVLCACQNYDYAPLETEQVEQLIAYLTDRLKLGFEKKRDAMWYLKQEGQDEYLKGLELYKQDKHEEAHQSFQQSASMKYPNGINAVAVDYLCGNVVQQDVEKGIAMQKEAAQLGSEIALRNLGVSYLTGQNGVSQDVNLAEQYLLEAAKRYDIRAYAWLGELYGDEQYGHRNVAKAAYWLQEATRGDDAMGWLYLGLFIGWEEYYLFQPRYIRYCLEKYIELSGAGDVAELLDCFTEEGSANIRYAKPLKPDYPYIDRTSALESTEDAHTLYTKALDLLEHRQTLSEGMNLMLEAAEQGHCKACHYAGCRLYDYGQGDEFQFSEDGVVDAFPVDMERAWDYLVHTGLTGNTDILQLLPYMGVEERDARRFLKLYMELTGDKTIERYILPNLGKIMAMDADYSGICDEYIVPLEQELYYLIQAEDSLDTRIEKLQQALREATHREFGESMAWRMATDPHDSMAREWKHECTDRDKIEKLLDIYLCIQKIQD